MTAAAIEDRPKIVKKSYTSLRRIRLWGEATETKTEIGVGSRANWNAGRVTGCLDLNLMMWNCGEKYMKIA